MSDLLAISGVINRLTQKSWDYLINPMWNTAHQIEHSFGVLFMRHKPVVSMWNGGNASRSDLERHHGCIRGQSGTRLPP